MSQNGSETLVPGRVCGDCTHAAFSEDGVHCRFFGEPIHNEKVAIECGEYSPSRAARQRLEEAVAPPALRVLKGGGERGPVPLDLVSRCEAYLDSLPCSNWGRGYDITGANSRQRAAEWLAEQIKGVAEHGA